MPLTDKDYQWPGRLVRRWRAKVRARKERERQAANEEEDVADKGEAEGKEK